MKHFNCMCMIVLLACGTHNTSSLYAESSELVENYNEATSFDSIDIVEDVDQNNETDSSHLRDINTSAEPTDMCACTDEDIADDSEEISPEISITQASTKNETSSQIANAEQQTALKDELDTMVDELIQSGAIRDDVSAIETQPKWKLLLARVGSYALSLGISCKDLLTNLYTNIKTTVGNYWSNKKNA